MEFPSFRKYERHTSAHSIIYLRNFQLKDFYHNLSTSLSDHLDQAQDLTLRRLSEQFVAVAGIAQQKKITMCFGSSSRRMGGGYGGGGYEGPNSRPVVVNHHHHGGGGMAGGMGGGRVGGGFGRPCMGQRPMGGGMMGMGGGRRRFGGGRRC